MSYKLICIDVDGTLFGEHKNISEENIKAISKAYNRGINVVITTGRIYINAAQISNRIKVDSPVIAANGGIIKEGRSGKTIYHAKFSYDDCVQLQKIIIKHNLIAHFYTSDKVISNGFIGNLAAQVYKYRNLDGKYKIRVDSCISNKTLTKRFREYENHLVKCVLYSTNINNIKEFKEEVIETTRFSVFGAGRYSVEVSPEGVSKGKSVEILSKYLNIDSSEVMCIGDNENDISMIKYAGLGVAMGNSIDELKALSDYITDTNLNNGVAKAIDKFIK